MPMRCPHCGSVVEPLRDTSGALFCPACQNTGHITAAWPPLPAQAAGPAAPSRAPQRPPGSDGQAPLSPPQASPGVPGKAVAALVLGLCAVVLSPLGIILGPLAIVYGAKAQGQLSRSPPGAEGRGMAVAGIVLGSVGIFLGLTVALAAVVFVLVSNLGEGFEEPRFTFHVDPSGEGGVLTVTSVAGLADWSDYELGGGARCTLPNGEVEAGDRIVCVTDGDVVLIDWLREETVYSATV